MQGSFTTKSAAETVSLGEKLGATLKGGDLVFLRGELGAGKTQFTKGIAKELGVADTVVSPTFTIERIYEGKRLVLHHFDLYRTHEDREIREQIIEFQSSPLDVTVVEWPENLAALAEMSHYEVSFKYVNDEEDREIKISEKGDRWS